MLLKLSTARRLFDRNYERSNLRRKCRSNYKFDEGILYYKKKTDTSLMLYDSSFNGRLSHELQVQIANIYQLAIKDKKIMVTAAASPAADCRYTYLWGNCHCFSLPFFLW